MPGRVYPLAIVLFLTIIYRGHAYGADTCEPLFVTSIRSVEVVRFQGLRSQQELDSHLGVDLQFQIDGRAIELGLYSFVAPRQRVSKFSSRPEFEKRLLLRLWSRATGSESRRLWVEDQAIVNHFRRKVLEFEDSYRDQLSAYAQELGLTVRGVSQLMTLVEYQWPFAWKSYVEPGVTQAEVDRVRKLNQTKPTPVAREAVDLDQFNGIEVGLVRLQLGNGQIIDKEVGSSATSAIDFTVVEKALNEGLDQATAQGQRPVGVEFYHNHPTTTYVSPLSGPDAFYMKKLSDEFSARHGRRVPFTVHALQRVFGQFYLFSAQY